MSTKQLIPFFVADRPASLRILRGVSTRGFLGPIGIMAHANTSDNFKALLKDFPCNPSSCKNECDTSCRRLKGRVIKMCDSGVFAKDGCKHDYPSLFETYEKMGVQFGVMIDHLRDRQKTLRSAKLGMKHYKMSKRSFKLVGVAQGRSVADYIKCYRALKALGYDHIAVGGLLKKRRNTSHYVYVRGNNVLFRVLERIRKEYPNDWLFALGCYSPGRHLRFQQLGLFGSDYKGWIFNYQPKHPESVARARASRYKEVRSFIAKNILGSPLYQSPKKVKLRKNGTLIIVSCGARKIWDDISNAGSTPARNAYTGRFFCLNKEYAERYADEWAILSAKYGLIKPDFVIKENYNVKFSHRNRTVTTKHIREQIFRSQYDRFFKVVVLGGREYGAAVSEAFTGLGVKIRRPLEEYHSMGLMERAVRRALEEQEPLE